MCSYRSKAIIRLTKALVQLILNAKDQQKKKNRELASSFPFKHYDKGLSKVTDLDV